MEKTDEDQFHAVADAVVSEDASGTFETRSVTTPTSNQILSCDAITSTPFHIKEAMKTLVLHTLTTQQKGVENRLSAALESLIELTVKKAFRSLQTIAEVTEAVIDNHGVIATPVALVKSK